MRVHSSAAHQSQSGSRREAGLINRRCKFIKLLGDGEVENKLTIQVDRVSASAKEKIEKAGGTVTLAVCSSDSPC